MSSKCFENRNWNIPKLFVEGYREGFILRVQLKNFLTFDEVEAFPGPCLNVVLGPNGTGKSSLTHAICLACAGTTSDVGRSNDLSSFVKKGKENSESFVEIDLLENRRKVTTIRRIINSNNKGSKWLMNGATSTQSAVKEIMNKLSIDVDNLCSFMPQDKVGSFTLFTPKDILINTLKSIKPSIDEKNLHDEQMELSNIERNKSDQRRIVEAKQNAYDGMNQEFERMKSDVERLKERKNLQEKLEFYEIKILKVEGDMNEQLEKEKQEKVNEASKVLSDERQKIAPLEQRERNLRTDQLKREKVTNMIEKKFRDLQETILKSKNEIQEGLDIAVEDARNALQSIHRTRVEKEKQLARVQKELQDNQSDLIRVEEKLPSIQKLIQDLDLQVQSFLDQQGRLNDEIQELTVSANHLAESIVVSTREFNSFQDFRQVYRSKLVGLNGKFGARDVIQAMDWLVSNEEELIQTDALKEHVYGPVAMYCDVADPACAIMIEKVIPANKLLGFLVLNHNDRMFLNQELREKKGWKVDIYTITNLFLPNGPYSADLLKRFEDIGMKGYLADQVDCPEAIRSLFNSFHGLQNVLWARSSSSFIEDKQRLSLLCPPGEGGMDSVRLYLENNRASRSSSSSNQPSASSDITEYSGKRSRYAGPHDPLSIASIGIYGKGLLGSRKGGNEMDVRRGQLEASIQDMRGRQQNMEQLIRMKRDELRGIQGETARLRQMKTESAKALRAPAELKQRIHRQERDIRNLEQYLCVDILNEKALKTRDYQERTNEMLEAMTNNLTDCKNSLDVQIEYEMASRLKSKFQTEIREIVENLKDVQTGVTNAKKLMNQLIKERDEFTKKKNEIEKKFRNLFEKFGGEETFVNEIYPRMMELCPEETIEEIEDKMTEMRLRVDSSVDNPRLIERFEATKVQLSQLLVELNKMKYEFENLEETLKERADAWIHGVENVAAKLNGSFQMFMKALGFDGEVVLRKTGAFDQYEMQMRVSFRDGTPLTDLSGTKNSGGERAVSTIMYLMSLQSMTSAPFRVVDEINQGMDERNERLVFDRIVQSCCRSKTATAGGIHGDDVDTMKSMDRKPQYFLVSPKLLAGLRSMDNPDVTVLLILNGPGVLYKWQLATVLGKMNRHRGREKDPVVDRDVDLSDDKKVKMEVNGVSHPKRVCIEIDDDSSVREKKVVKKDPIRSWLVKKEEKVVKPNRMHLMNREVIVLYDDDDP